MPPPFPTDASKSDILSNASATYNTRVKLYTVIQYRLLQHVERSIRDLRHLLWLGDSSTATFPNWASFKICYDDGKPQKAVPQCFSHGVLFPSGFPWWYQSARCKRSPTNVLSHQSHWSRQASNALDYSIFCKQTHLGPHFWQIKRTAPLFK